MLTTRALSDRSASGRKGATFVEATLVLLFLLGVIFLLMDVSWGVFAKVTLQHAVRAGVRYAITSQTSTDSSSGNPLGQVASIKQKVQNQAMGLLSDSDMANKVFVKFYAVGGNPPTQVNGTGSNTGGNLIVVSVENYSLKPLGPLLRSGTPLSITVRAGDLLEASPISGAPAL